MTSHMHCEINLGSKLFITEGADVGFMVYSDRAGAGPGPGTGPGPRQLGL